MWLLPTRNEMKELGEMSEEKTTNLSIQCPVHMTSSSHGGYSTTLIVCSEVWQVMYCRRYSSFLHVKGTVAVLLI